MTAADVAVLAIGWLLMAWGGIGARRRLPGPLRRLQVEPDSGWSTALTSLGIGATGAEVLNLAARLSEGQSIWLRLLWVMLAVVGNAAVDIVLLVGPRAFVDGLLRRSRRRRTTEPPVPTKSRQFVS